MDIYFLISWLCLTALLASSCLAQSDIETRFNTTEDTIYTQVGDEVQLKCIINQGPLFVIQNKLEVLHVNPVTKEETGMAIVAILEDSADPDHYDAKIDANSINANEVAVVFTIKRVRDIDDGPYLCQTPLRDNKGLITSRVDLVVVKEIQAVQLHFDNHEPVTKKHADPIQINSGTYKVKCVAVGANPAAKEVKLYLDGVPVETRDLNVTLEDGAKSRSYLSSVTGELDITVYSSGKSIKCVAKDFNDNAMTTELGIEVNTYDPEIMCNDSSAHVGEMDPVLTCVVNHADINVESFAFQIGKTGEVIEDGTTGKNNVKVTSKKISSEVSEVSLNLHKALDWHFEDQFYIVIRTKGGHVTKERLQLIKLYKETIDEQEENSGDSANIVDGKMAVLVSVLLGFFVQWF